MLEGSRGQMLLLEVHFGRRVLREGAIYIVLTKVPSVCMCRSHTPGNHDTTGHIYTSTHLHKTQIIENKFSNPQKTNSAKGGNHPAKRRQDELHQGQDYSTGQAQVQCRKKAKLHRSYSKSYRHQRRDIKTQNRQRQSRACCTSRLTTKRKTTQRTYFNLAARCGTDKRKGGSGTFRRMPAQGV